MRVDDLEGSTLMQAETLRAGLPARSSRCRRRRSCCAAIARPTPRCCKYEARLRLTEAFDVQRARRLRPLLRAARRVAAVRRPFVHDQSGRSSTCRSPRRRGARAGAGGAHGERRGRAEGRAVDVAAARAARPASGGGSARCACCSPTSRGASTPSRASRATSCAAFARRMWFDWVKLKAEQEFLTRARRPSCRRRSAEDGGG